MDDNQIFVIFLFFGIFVSSSLILVRKKILKEHKDTFSEKIKEFMAMAPNDFATKFIARKIPELLGTNIKEQYTVEEIKKGFHNFAPKYLFETSILLLFISYNIAKSRNKNITIEHILNFAKLSALPSFGMVAFGFHKNYDEEYEMILNDRFQLYQNKSIEKIKNIFSNICFLEIEKNILITEKNLTENITNDFLLIENHFNSLFENKKLFIYAEIIYMYLNQNYKKFERIANKNIEEKDSIESLMYNIERAEPTPFFIETRKLVGNWLQKRMNQIEGTRWIKAYYTYPAFEHLSFLYKNQIFCVLIDIIDERTKKSWLPEQTKNLLIKECERNNLIPCLYKVFVDNPEKPTYNTLKQYSDGWNLYSAITGEPIIPERLGSDKLIEMSEWELNDFSIQIVRDYIVEKLHYKIISYQNIVGIDPQLWFVDDNNNRSYVVVRHTMFPNTKAEEPKNINQIQTRCKGHSGYFASVSLCSETQNKSILYRGQGCLVSFSGLEKLETQEIHDDKLKFLFEDITLKISAQIANTFMKLNIYNLTENEKLDYLYVYSTELLLCIYTILINKENTSFEENNLFPILLAYFEKITPHRHKELINWEYIIMNRVKLYRQILKLEKEKQSTIFTKICQHSLKKGTIYTYDEIESIPKTEYDKSLNEIYLKIKDSKIEEEILNKLSNAL